MSFGKAGYDGKKGYTKKPMFDLSDGDVVARILPPFGTLRDNENGWHVFHSVHWGYKTLEGKSRPFESPLVEKFNEDKTRTVLVKDAALDRLEDLRAKLAKAREEGNVAFEAKLNTLVGPNRAIYNIDKNQYLNVMLLDGTIGVLKIRTTMFKELMVTIKELEKGGLDPISLENGVFFRFHKEGTWNQTVFKATAYRESLNGPIVMSAIGPDLLPRLLKEASELTTLFNKPTAEEVAQIVSESDLLTGKSAACNRIFDARWKATKDSKAATARYEDGPDNDVTDTVPAATVKAPAAQMEAPVAQAAPAAKAAPTAAPVAVPKTTQAQAIDDLSDADFFKMVESP